MGLQSAVGMASDPIVRPGADLFALPRFAPGPGVVQLAYWTAGGWKNGHRVLGPGLAQRGGGGMTARTTIVIVTYRSKGVVDRALDALAPLARAGSVECIVVDNDSGDGTAEYVESRYPFVRMLPSRINLGFGRGCNAGLELASTEFVFFLNPDAVLDAESLARLERFLDEHPAAGLVAPAIENGSDGVQPVRPLPTPLGVVAAEAGVGAAESVAVEVGAAPFRCEWLCGAALMGRRSVLDALGGFDPRFFLYYEETDLCLRAQQAGHELWMVPEAVAHHLCGASAERTDERLWFGCIAEHYFESRHYYLVKHFGHLRACSAAVAELGIMAARSLANKLRHRPDDRLHFRLQSSVLKTPRQPVG